MATKTNGHAKNGNGKHDPGAAEVASLRAGIAGAEARLAELERARADAEAKHAELIAQRPELAAAAHARGDAEAAAQLKELNTRALDFESVTLGLDTEAGKVSAQLRGWRVELAALEQAARDTEVDQLKAAYAASLRAAGDALEPYKAAVARARDAADRLHAKQAEYGRHPLNLNHDFALLLQAYTAAELEPWLGLFVGGLTYSLKREARARIYGTPAPTAQPAAEDAAPVPA